MPQQTPAKPQVIVTKWEESRHSAAFAGEAGLNNLGPDMMEAWYCFLGNLLRESGKQIMMWDDHFVNREYLVPRDQRSKGIG